MILRYQDRSGRGPWRPGFSHLWQDDSRRFDLPPLQQDFGIDFQPIVDAAFKRGLHLGTAVRGWDKLNTWFTAKERINLAGLGFYVANCGDCEVLGETKWQLVIGSKSPLYELPAAILVESN